MYGFWVDEQCIAMCGSAADNVVKADEIRTLVKDIWDIRMAKLRSSIDVFFKSDATHARVLTTQCHTMHVHICT